MKTILVTGGPVHAYLDAVKIITNRFKGGLMSDLAEDLLEFDTRIVYLCAPGGMSKTPRKHERIEVVYHDGFGDYRQKVAELAPKMDAVILGAAVANLIPAAKIDGKFPSHNYKPGDVIPINFTIAPRVIDEVKRVAPLTHLFGFKLLSGVTNEELIRAAYGVVIDSRATAVFANDALDLQQKYAVTKERGVHPLTQEELASWIWTMINDVYYSTVVDSGPPPSNEAVRRFHELVQNYSCFFKPNEVGLIFGTVAVRHESGFVTGGRGKNELASLSNVTWVDHQGRKVHVTGSVKASLNAPLLSRMFDNPLVEYVVHYHCQYPGIPTVDYAPPGTVRDSERRNGTSFNIKDHGCILLFDKEGRRL